MGMMIMTGFTDHEWHPKDARPDEKPVPQTEPHEIHTGKDDAPVRSWHDAFPY